MNYLQKYRNTWGKESTILNKSIDWNGEYED